MNRIILIGNGFDLAHGMKTSYQNFIDDYWKKEIEQIIAHSKQGAVKYYANDQFSVDTFLPFTFDKYHFKDLVEQLGKVDKKVSFKNSFFKRICSKYSISNWVDVEDEYYKVLKQIVSNISENENDSYIVKLNNELFEIQNLLCEYLKEVEGDFKFESVKRKSFRISDIIYERFKPQDINRTGKQNLAEIESEKLISEQSSVNQQIRNYDEKQLFENLRKITSDYFSVENMLKVLNMKTSENYLEIRPSSILLLNFNYTDTAGYYLSSRGFNHETSHAQMISIHGSNIQTDRNPIIFGYGDELDDDYRNIEKLNNNKYLENIKSIRYSSTSNYKHLIEYLDSDVFQVFIFGHSCGTSDRTMLNTIFEHDNCVSIKPYYHLKSDETDNYQDLTINISRNFNDKKKLRDRLVNKTFCEPLG